MDVSFCYKYKNILVYVSWVIHKLKESKDILERPNYGFSKLIQKIAKTAPKVKFMPKHPNLIWHANLWTDSILKEKQNNLIFGGSINLVVKIHVFIF